MVRIFQKKRLHLSAFMAIFLCFELLLAMLPQTVRAENLSETEMVNATITYLKGDQEHVLAGSILASAGTTAGDWYAFGLGQYGAQDTYDDYLQALETYVTECYASGKGLSGSKATEWHRIIFAVLACGGDPTSFGTDASGHKINLVADGVYNCKVGTPWRQGINGAVFALLALDTKRYTVPATAAYNREAFIAYILGKELKNGGFALSGTTPNVDVTAMVLQALAPYYKTRTDVTAAVDRGLAILAGLLQKDGDYMSYGVANAESTAQVLVALSSLGIDAKTDTRFITSTGKNVTDGIRKYYNTATGGFEHVVSYGVDGMATQQCFYALVSYVRLQSGKTGIYDFTGGVVEEEPATEGNESDSEQTDKDHGGKVDPSDPPVVDNTAMIEKLNTDIWTAVDPLRVAQEDGDAVKSLIKRYRQLSKSDRAKVTNADSLLEAYAVIQSLEKGIIPKRVFQNIRQTGEKFVYTGQTGIIDYRYTLDGKKMKAAKKMSAKITLDAVPQEGFLEPVFSFRVKQNTFNGEVSLRIQTGLIAGTYQAYWYNADKGELELLEETVPISKKGYAVLQLYTGGSYYISKGIAANQEAIPVTVVAESKKSSADDYGKADDSGDLRITRAEGVITKEEFEQIMGTDRLLCVESETEEGSWYALTFAGEDLQQAQEVALGISSTCDKEEEIKKLSDHPYLISFTQRTAFPCEVLVELAVKLADGDYILFAYDGQKQRVDAIQKVTVADQKTRFLVSEGGDYFLAKSARTSVEDETETAKLEKKAQSVQEETTTQAAEDETEQPDSTQMNPKEESQVMVIVAVLIMVIIAGGIYAKKKRQ